MGRGFRPLVAAIVALELASAVQRADAANIWYVDDDAAGVTCANWTNACADLQNALDLALPGDEVWVAAGSYRPDRTTGDRNATFQLLSGVAIYGGFAGGETQRNQRDPVSNVITLTGDLAANDEAIACAVDSPDCDANGGKCLSSGFCIVPNNIAENAYHVVTGIGVDATAILDGFLITGGNADANFGDPNSWGGGLFAERGSPSITGCVFQANRADFGGAVFSSGSLATYINCRFSGNVATFGGAFSIEPFDGNLGSPTMVNCVFCGNSADLGGAIISWDDVSPMLRNCTFTENAAVDAGGAMASMNSNVVADNCIFWGNSDSTGHGDTAQIVTIKGNPTINHSCIQGGWTGTGTGNISDNPLFVGPGCDDLHLQTTSPCIDTGSNEAVVTGEDFDGFPRIISGTVDMGAFEFFDIEGDIDCDGDVDLDDLAELVSCIGGPGSLLPQCIKADIDGDGDVDLDDFALFQNAFGSAL